ncbi:MAG: zinc ribbon domain-containing protein [Planctomycetota bacterium]
MAEDDRHMVDDRQLLRLSRNLVAAAIAIFGTLLALEYTWSFLYYAVSEDLMSAATLLIPIGVLVTAVLKRHAISRKLIKATRVDLCPACQYPIPQRTSRFCPECGLRLTGPADNDE